MTRILGLFFLICLFAEGQAVRLASRQHNIRLVGLVGKEELCSYAKEATEEEAKGREISSKNADYLLEMKKYSTSNMNFFFSQDEEDFTVVSKGNLADNTCNLVSVDDEKFPGFNTYVTMALSNFEGHAGVTYSNVGGLAKNISSSVVLPHSEVTGTTLKSSSRTWTIPATSGNSFVFRFSLPLKDPNNNANKKSTQIPSTGAKEMNVATTLASLLLLVTHIFLQE